MKVAISYSGLEGARATLTKELPQWDFDRVSKASAVDWQPWLGRIAADGGTGAQNVNSHHAHWAGVAAPAFKAIFTSAATFFFFLGGISF